MLQLKRSSVYQALAAEDIAEAKAEGNAQGVAQGKIEAERELCLELVKKHHPALLERAAPLIEACDDAGLLRKWILSASDSDCGELGRLLSRAASQKADRR